MDKVIEDYLRSYAAAEKTLANLGYIYNGGEEWKPPIDKPIDTRTDEEKALDNLMTAYWDVRNEKQGHSPVVIKVLAAIKAGKIHNVTWSKS